MSTPAGTGPGSVSAAAAYARLIRDHAFAVMAFVVLCVGGTVLVESGQPKSFVATSQVTFAPRSQSDAVSGVTSSQDDDPAVLAARALVLATSDGVIERTRRDLRLDESIGALRSRVSVAYDPVSDALQLSATSEVAENAARLSNALAQTVVDVQTSTQRSTIATTARLLENQYARLRRRGGEGRRDPVALGILTRIAYLRTLETSARPVTLEVRASTPTSPASPKIARDAALAGVAALAVGFLVAFLRVALTKRFRDVGEVRRSLGREVVGELGAGDPVEELGILFANARLGTARTVLVADAERRGVGAEVALGFAQTAARSGARVALVDCDLRGQTVSRRLGVSPAALGLADVSSGRAHLADAMTLTDVGVGTGEGGEVWLLPAGTVTEGRTAVHPERFQSAVEEIASGVDWVVLSGPVPWDSADARSVLPAADLVLVCVRLRATDRRAAGRSLAIAGLAGARTVAVVVSGVESRRSRGWSVPVLRRRTA